MSGLYDGIGDRGFGAFAIAEYYRSTFQTHDRVTTDLVATINDSRALDVDR